MQFYIKSETVVSTGKTLEYTFTADETVLGTTPLIYSDVNSKMELVRKTTKVNFPKEIHVYNTRPRNVALRLDYLP